MLMTTHVNMKSIHIHTLPYWTHQICRRPVKLTLALAGPDRVTVQTVVD